MTMGIFHNFLSAKNHTDLVNLYMHSFNKIIISTKVQNIVLKLTQNGILVQTFGLLM